MKRFVLFIALVIGFATIPAARAQEEDERPQCTLDEIMSYTDDATADLDYYAALFPELTDKTNAEVIDLYFEVVDKQQAYVDKQAEVPACLLTFSSFMETQLSYYSQAIGILMIVLLDAREVDAAVEEITDISARIRVQNERMDAITVEVLSQVED